LLLFFLHNIVLPENVSDYWKWLLDLIKDYSFSDVYQMFTSIEQRVHRVHVDSNWHKQVPPKVSLFVGHLFRNQLPTKNNISRQGIIQAVANVYARGCALQEYVDHLFIC